MVERFTWSPISKPKPPDKAEPIKKERAYWITAWVSGRDLAQVRNLIEGLAHEVVVHVHRSRPTDDRGRPTDDE
jgi:hypothetical protein